MIVKLFCDEDIMVPDYLEDDDYVPVPLGCRFK